MIYMKDIKMCAIGEVSSLFNTLPVILKKTFDAHSRILDRSWLLESNFLLLSFCELAENVEVKVSIDNEFQTFKKLLGQYQDVGGAVQVQHLCVGVVPEGVHCHDEPRNGLLCLQVLCEAARAQHLSEDNGLNVGERDVRDEARRSDADQKAVENTKTEEEKVIDCTEKKAFEKQDKKCRAGSMNQKVEKTSRFHAKENAVLIVESKLSREDPIATEEIRAKDDSRTNSGPKDETSGHVGENPDRFDGSEMEEAVEGGRVTIEEVKKADQTIVEEQPSENVLVLGEAVQAQHLSEDELSDVVCDRGQVTNPCPEDVLGQSRVSSSTTVHGFKHGENKQVDFFQLSPAFPLIPLNSSELNFLPDQMRNSPVPDLSSSKPLPTAPGSFFILSSLSPLPVHSAKEKKSRKKCSNKRLTAATTFKVKKSRKRSMTKVKASSR